MEWRGLKHALKSIILNFDGSIKNLHLDFEEAMCSIISTKIACKKVSFVTIGWTNRQRTTHPDQIDWSIAW